MPTYRYRCSDCGEEFELWQSIKDDAIRTHDDGCGGPVLKVLTPAGIVLKGSGFYKTDSRSSDRKRTRTDGSKAKDGGDSGGSSDQTSSSSESSSDSSSSDSSSGSGSESKGGDSTSSTPTKKSGDSKSAAGAAKPS
jgi:putative FmdB family regulatory protein